MADPVIFDPAYLALVSDQIAQAKTNSDAGVAAEDRLTAAITASTAAQQAQQVALVTAATSVGPQEVLLRIVTALIPARATGAAALVAEAVQISTEIGKALAAPVPSPAPVPAPAPAPAPVPAPAPAATPGALTWTGDSGATHDWGDTFCQQLAALPGVTVQSCVYSQAGKRVDFTYTANGTASTGGATRAFGPT